MRVMFQKGNKCSAVREFEFYGEACKEARRLAMESDTEILMMVYDVKRECFIKHRKETKFGGKIIFELSTESYLTK